MFRFSFISLRGQFKRVESDNSAASAYGRPVAVDVARHKLHASRTTPARPLSQEDTDEPLVEVPADIFTLVNRRMRYFAKLLRHILDQLFGV